jgi:hypothetical protein
VRYRRDFSPLPASAYFYRPLPLRRSSELFLASSSRCVKSVLQTVSHVVRVSSSVSFTRHGQDTPCADFRPSPLSDPPQHHRAFSCSDQQVIVTVDIGAYSRTSRDREEGTTLALCVGNYETMSSLYRHELHLHWPFWPLRLTLSVMVWVWVYAQ